jgi:uncharacterized membrane protein YjjP (DUF1212 family)
MMQKMNLKEVLYYAMEIGMRLLMSGAEVSRVEDTIGRICRAYGATRVDVFSITACIIVSVENAEGEVETLTRRVSGYINDLEKVDRLNALSRDICEYNLGKTQIKERLAQIEQSQTYPVWGTMLASGLAAGTSAILFGGTYFDALTAALVGILLRICMNYVERWKTTAVFYSIMCAFVAGVISIVFVSVGMGEHLDKIIIGNVMLLMSGVQLTNSIRDLIGGDLMSGVLRFADAMITAIAVASGFVLATMLLGGA